MKKTFYKILFAFAFSSVLLFSFAFAEEGEYEVIKEYVFRNDLGTTLDEHAFVEILIGSGDFVSYQDDESIILSPNPDEIREDIYGNKYAYYSLEGMNPRQRLKITVKRRFRTYNYDEMIPTRSNTNKEDVPEYYLDPQTRIDSDNEDIYSKAKELTEDVVSDYKKAEAIFEFVNVKVIYDTSSSYANKGSISAFKNLKGVCEEFATLFVAMCRSVDIPSRVVCGFRVNKTISTNDSGDRTEKYELIDHAWAEIYLEDYGWVPVDPTFFNVYGSNKVVNLDAFCKIRSNDLIAVSLYDYDYPDWSYRPSGISDDYSVIFRKISGDDATSGDHSFNDIDEYDWAEKSINYLYDIGVVKGYSDELYGPQNNISRIEFMSMLARTLRYKETDAVNKGLVYYYLDYDISHWSKDDYDFLMRCYQALKPSDIVSAGYAVVADIFNQGKLDMDKPITRAEVVALMDVFLKDDYSETDLTDINNSRFKNSIIKAYNSGLIVGYPDHSFRPNGLITRAEMAVVLERYIGNSVYTIL